jgi:hypothetical protein
MKSGEQKKPRQDKTRQMAMAAVARLFSLLDA